MGLFANGRTIAVIRSGRRRTSPADTRSPKSPRAAAYILGRLSNKELIAAPRSEFVYVALLQRKGLDRKYRLEALEGLAQARQTGTLSRS